jgi:nitric oxide reductase large subunit
MSWTGSKHWRKSKYVRNFNWKPGVGEHLSDVDIMWRTKVILCVVLGCAIEEWIQLVREVSRCSACVNTLTIFWENAG